MAYDIWHICACIFHGGKQHALLHTADLCSCRNPADMGGRMMTFTYVALLSGLVAWNIPGGADSIMTRISVSSAVATVRITDPALLGHNAEQVCLMVMLRHSIVQPVIESGNKLNGRRCAFAVVGGACAGLLPALRVPARLHDSKICCCRVLNPSIVWQPHHLHARCWMSMSQH
jgi:hypothetical protein